MKKVILFFTVFCALAVLGCSKDDPVRKQVIPPPDQTDYGNGNFSNNTTERVEFNNGYYFRIHLGGVAVGNDAPAGSIAEEGTYTFIGNVYTINVTNWTTLNHTNRDYAISQLAAAPNPINEQYNAVLSGNSLTLYILDNPVLQRWD